MFLSGCLPMNEQTAVSTQVSPITSLHLTLCAAPNTDNMAAFKILSSMADTDITFTLSTSLYSQSSLPDVSVGFVDGLYSLDTVL